MEANLLTSITSIVLSLGFSYIPKLDVWYAKLDGTKKRLLMVGLLLIVALVSFGLGCAGWWVKITCDQEGVKGMIEAFILAVIANQSAYLISPKTERVKAAISEREQQEGLG